MQSYSTYPETEVLALTLDKFSAIAPGVLFEWLITPENCWQFRYISRRLEQTIRTVSRAELLRKGFMAIVHPKDRARVSEGALLAYQEHRIWSDVFRLPQQGSLPQSWLQACALPKSNQEQGVIYTGLFIDISKRMNGAFARVDIASQEEYHFGILKQLLFRLIA
jgi:hypothetical protein